MQWIGRMACRKALLLIMPGLSSSSLTTHFYIYIYNIYICHISYIRRTTIAPFGAPKGPQHQPHRPHGPHRVTEPGSDARDASSLFSPVPTRARRFPVAKGHPEPGSAWRKRSAPVLRSSAGGGTSTCKWNRRGLCCLAGWWGACDTMTRAVARFHSPPTRR